MTSPTHSHPNFASVRALRRLLTIEKNLLQMLIDGQPLPYMLQQLAQAIALLANHAACAICLPTAPDALPAAPITVGLPDLVDLLQPIPQIENNITVIADIESESARGQPAAWLDAMRAAGLRACWLLPLQTPLHKTSGTFALYFQSPHTPRHAELELVQHAALLAERVITRQRQDEQLAESEEMFRAVFENQIDAMAIVDPESQTLLRVNPAFESMLLYPQDSAIGLSLTAFSARPAKTREQLKRLRSVLDLAPKTETTTPIPVWQRWLKRRDGSIFRAEISAYWLPMQGRQLICGIARDLTAIRQSKHALSLASNVFENLSDGIAIGAWPGTILNANHALLAMTGFTLEELVGQDSSMLYQDAKLWQQLAAEAVRSNLTSRSNVRLRRKDGGLLPCLLTLHRMRADAEHGAATTLIAVYQDLSLRQQQEQRLQFLSDHDLLTSLPNRFLFYQRLGQAVTQASKVKANSVPQFAVLSIDLDRFKNINETFGHPVGDQLLELTARRIEQVLSTGDLLARFGGDEFAILTSRPQEETAILYFVEKLMAGFALPFEIDGQELFITASVGISLFPQDGRSAETLIRSADVALYRAKSEGKNNYQFFAAEMGRDSLSRMQLENALRRALPEQEFELYYQAKVRIPTDQVYGMEALLRWNHPQLGLLGPVDFIPLVEEMGLIREVGSWALQQACRQNALWQQAGFKPVMVSVNLSALQMADDVASLVAQALQDSELLPGWLDLELTEGTIMSAPKNAAVLQTLREMGVKISIDDFGTGYSSLSYLKQLPIDTLKIDQSFVRDISNNTNDGAIIDAIIALARGLDIDVVAEGVETTEQLRFLSDRGCDAYQGFLFSKPLTAGDFEKLLSTSVQ
ncbi:MAG: EAL domain-containing protein [Herbaspirillum sp.]